MWPFQATHLPSFWNNSEFSKLLNALLLGPLRRELLPVPPSEGLGIAGSVEWAISYVKTEMTTK